MGSRPTSQFHLKNSIKKNPCALLCSLLIIDSLVIFSESGGICFGNYVTLSCQESGVSESGAVRNTPSTYLLINVTVCLGSALSQHVFNTPYRDNTIMVRSPLAMSPPSKFTSSVEDTPTPTRMATNGSNTTVTFPVPQSEWKFCTPKRPRTKSLRTPEYDDGKIVFKDFHTKSKTKNARSPAAASSATSYSLSPLSLKFSSTYVAAVHKRRAAIVRELMGSDNSSSCVNTDKGKAMNS